jgi:hypothetical protein
VCVVGVDVVSCKIRTRLRRNLERSRVTRIVMYQWVLDSADRKVDLDETSYVIVEVRRYDRATSLQRTDV